MKKYILFLFSVCIFAFQTNTAQTKEADSAYLQKAFQQSVNYYYSSIAENAHLYIGSESQFRIDEANIKGNQYLDTNVMVNGSVYYNGTLYNDLGLLYDIYYDVVLIYNYQQSINLSLISEKLSYFTMLKDTFVRIVKDSGDKVLPGTGFYQKLYSGKTTVFAKRKKVAEERNSGSGLSEKKFVQHDYYFIKWDNNYYDIGTQKSFFRLFKERGKEVRRYLRKNNISFREQREYAIVKAAHYYDELTK